MCPLFRNHMKRIADEEFDVMKFPSLFGMRFKVIGT